MTVTSCCGAVSSMTAEVDGRTGLIKSDTQPLSCRVEEDWVADFYQGIYPAQQVELVVAMYGPEGNAIYHSNLIPIAEASVPAMSMIGGWLLLVCAAVALRQRVPLRDSAVDPQR